jgi:hypothetical protein
VFAQRSSVGLDFVPVKVAATLVKKFDVYADGELIYSADECHHSLVKVNIGREVKQLKVVFNETWGADDVRLFSCDVE